MQQEKGRRGARPANARARLQDSPFSLLLLHLGASRFEQCAWSNRMFGGLAVPLTIFCIATYRKGDEFLRECRRQGCRVLLLTEEKLRDADWPRDAIDEFYYLRRDMPAEDIRKGIANVGRTAADRPHRRARRLRRRAGGDAARVPARPGHGRDDRARVSRQAGDARPRPQRRHPLSGLRPRAQQRQRSASGRAASRRRGC